MILTETEVINLIIEHNNSIDLIFYFLEKNCNINFDFKMDEIGLFDEVTAQGLFLLCNGKEEDFFTPYTDEEAKNINKIIHSIDKIEFLTNLFKLLDDNQKNKIENNIKEIDERARIIGVIEEINKVKINIDEIYNNISKENNIITNIKLATFFDDKIEKLKLDLNGNMSKKIKFGFTQKFAYMIIIDIFFIILSIWFNIFF